VTVGPEVLKTQIFHGWGGIIYEFSQKNQIKTGFESILFEIKAFSETFSH